MEMPTAREVKRSLSALGTSASPPPSTSSSPSLSPGKSQSVPNPSPLRNSHAPSPLSSPQNITTALRPLKSSASPLSQSSVPSSPTKMTSLSRPPHQLMQMTSRASLDGSLAPDAASRPPHPRISEGSTSSPPIPPLAPRPILPDGRLSTSSQSREATQESASTQPVSSRGRSSVDTDAISVHSSRSQLVSPPPIVRQPSLRSKLSLPNLRRNRSRQDETSSIGSGSQGPDNDTMQVQDMDFELVRPTIAQLQSARTSEDSGMLGKEGSIDVRPDPSFLRPESPTVSSSSGGTSAGRRSPAIISEPSASASWQPLTHKPTDSESSMDAHRQRELKWVALMASVPPAQSKKNKKVKKMLVDGVPSSVRYLVWLHLTDGKARGVPGVYTQLGSRGRVPAFVEIERDVQRCFRDHPQLQSTQGPLLSLLQAYLTMVPDIQYSTGNFNFGCPDAAAHSLAFRFDVGRWSIVITRTGGRCLLDFCFRHGHPPETLLLVNYDTTRSRRGLV